MNNKKKYFIGGSRFTTVFGIVWICIVVLLTASFGGMFLNSGGNFPFLVIMVFIMLVPLAMLAVGILLIVSNIKGVKRMNYALQGRKAYGIVTESYIKTGRNSSYYLSVSYHTESGEEREFYTCPDPKLMQYFEVGKRIPIFVNGEFAFYDIDSIRNGSYEEQSKTIRCVCGYEVQNGLFYCPKCGRSLEEMHTNCDNNVHANFCPSCGSKLESEDKFCRNCGYKL